VWVDNELELGFNERLGFWLGLELGPVLGNELELGFNIVFT
jgi:hypothetical protein